MNSAVLMPRVIREYRGFRVSRNGFIGLGWSNASDCETGGVSFVRHEATLVERLDGP